MRKTALKATVMTVLLTAGIAMGAENVEQAIRVRAMHAVLTTQSVPSVVEEQRSIVHRATLGSSSQLEMLGSYYIFGRSA
ncbi:MAG: hypothetical protein HY961_03370, partial [Ignavibacteriae bacterium]|nr:hypothetical protein [Ignavibacteriota bacterium]